MKKRLLLTVSAGLAAAALGVGASLALFNDRTPAAGTSITAGRLCLSSARNAGDPVPGPMFYVTAAQGQQTIPPHHSGLYPTGLWAPGDVHQRTLTVFNDPLRCPSTLDAWLDTVSASLRPGSDPELAERLTVKVLAPDGANIDQVVAQGRLSQFLAGPVPLRYPDSGGKIPAYAGSNVQMKFQVEFDRDADNAYQDKSLIVDFTVTGEQMAHNP